MRSLPIECRHLRNAAVRYCWMQRGSREFLKKHQAVEFIWSDADVVIGRAPDAEFRSGQPRVQTFSLA
jgi:hypothetical protein